MYTFVAFIIVVVLIGCSNTLYLHAKALTLQLPKTQIGLLHEAIPPVSLLFGGDVLLGRHVETLMATRTYPFPFTNLLDLITQHDRTIINFEGVIPEKHEQTKDFEMRFSMSTDVASQLKRAGIDGVSLGNNHAFDYGKRGFTHTRKVFGEEGIMTIGHPDNEEAYTKHIEQLGRIRVGYLMLHAVEDTGTTTAELMEGLSDISDIQIVFVHWGNEYVRTHNEKQEHLAHALIDAGADAVIGHHPHVMQDIELYQDVPIFYSLGNLIFDQYFSDEVQTGYLVSLSLTPTEITYILHPYSALFDRSHPQLLSGTERDLVFKNLLNSSFFTEEERVNGSFTRTVNK